MEVHNNLLAVGEQVGEMSKGNAVLCGLEPHVLLFFVVGKFDEVSKHIGFHCYAAHDLIPIQNLLRHKHSKQQSGALFDTCFNLYANSLIFQLSSSTVVKCIFMIKCLHDYKGAGYGKYTIML